MLTGALLAAVVVLPARAQVTVHAALSATAPTQAAQTQALPQSQPAPSSPAAASQAPASTNSATNDPSLPQPKTLTAKAIDTVKQVDRTSDGAVVIATVPREKMVLAQTPQGFRFGVLKKAFDEANADGFMGTDEASLIERAGNAVHVVMGSVRNMKITTPADMELAEFFLAQENREMSLSG